MSELSTSPTRAVLARGSLYTIASATQMAAAVIALPLLTRQTSQVAMGAISAALVVYPVLASLAGAGLPVAIARPIYDRNPDGLIQAKSLLLATFAVSAPFLAVAHLAGPVWIEVFDGIRYEGALAWAVAAAGALVAFTGVQHILRAQDLAGWFVASTGLAAVGGQAAGLGLVVLRGEPEGYLIGLTLGLAAGAAVGMIPLGSHALRWPSAALLGDSFRLGAPVLPHLLALLVLSLGDRVVIERVEGLDAVGEYHVAYVTGALGIVVLSAFNNAWAPQIYSADAESRWQVLATTTRDLYPLAGLVAVGLAVGAPLGLRVMAPAGYDLETIAPVTAVIALSILPYLAYLSRVHVIFQLRRTAALAVATPTAALVNIIANVLLVPPLGLLGAAVATVGSYALLAAVVDRYARRLAVVPWHSGAARSTSVVTLVLVAIATVAPVQGPAMVVRGFLGVIVLSALLVRVRRLTHVEPPVLSASAVAADLHGPGDAS